VAEAVIPASVHVLTGAERLVAQARARLHLGAMRDATDSQEDTVVLSIRLEGRAQDEGLVRANDFALFLTRTLALLRRLEGGAPEIIYRIVELEIGSAAVALRADAPAPSSDPRRIVGKFVEGFAALRDGRLKQLPFDSDTKEAFLELSAPLRRSLRLIHVGTADTNVDIMSRDVHEPISLAPQDERHSVGRYSGFVDAINVHGDPVFYLYPSSGDPKIRCRFDRSLIDDARAALKRYTTVYGLLQYGEGSVHPARIDVDRLVVNRDARDLPTLRSLYGKYAGLTDGLSSVEYVRHLRDAAD
jgi:hypothetical protein